MKINEARSMTQDQLQDEVRKLQKEAFNLQIQKVSGQLDKPLKLRATRRDIARLKTALREQQIKAQADKKPATQTEPKQRKA